MTDNFHFNKIEPAIGELVIANPIKRNALNSDMWAALPGLLAKIKTDRRLKVLILRGQGEHFAAGADISEFKTLYATPESSAHISDAINAAMTALARFPTPTIAMIRGACIGGGCGLSLSCDIRIADNSAKFAITPAKLGLVYPYGDVQRLIETVGIPNAKDILFSARLITAKEAKKIGLINYRYKPHKLQSAILDYARNISQLSTASAKVTKAMFAAYQSGQFGDNTQSKKWFLESFSGQDFEEGYTAFLEKRKPNFDA